MRFYQRRVQVQDPGFASLDRVYGPGGDYLGWDGRVRGPAFSSQAAEMDGRVVLEISATVL
jgi:hypothetical protein